MAAGQTDVLVVGGGPAGATIAAFLASRGIATLVVESASGPRWKPGEVLAPNCVAALYALGLAEELARRPQLASACWGLRRRWGAPVEEIRDYVAEPGASGFIVDRAAFESLLARRAISAGARWQWSTRFRDASRQPGEWRVSLETRTASSLNDAEVAARFLVDASGRAACLARKQGAKRRRATRRIAICRQLAAPASSGWVQVESLAAGWRYRASGPGRERSEVLVTSPEELRLTAAPGVGHVCDASYALLDRCAGEGWLAVGDAAASFDPIASQGIAHALSSAIAAARAVADELERPAAGAGDLYDRCTRATWQYSLRGSLAVYRSERRWPRAGFWVEAQREPDFSAAGPEGGSWR